MYRGMGQTPAYQSIGIAPPVINEYQPIPPGSPTSATVILGGRAPSACGLFSNQTGCVWSWTQGTGQLVLIGGIGLVILLALLRGGR